MLRVGLTGGVGCGKTTVAAMMRELGCVVLDADAVAHRLIEPGQPAYHEIVREFGASLRGPAETGGRIDRAALAAIVFADPARLERLNHIVHPRVVEALHAELAALARQQPRAIAVVEAALLIESSYHERLDCVVVVWCEPEQQIERLVHRNLGRGLTREQAEQRVAAQMRLDQKRRMADYEIDGSGPLEITRRQVETLVVRLKQLAAA